VILGLFISQSANASSFELYATGFWGSKTGLFKVDPDTGSASYIGAVISPNAGIDFAPSGVLYGVWGSTLQTYNPDSGEVTTITSDLPDFMISVCFDPNGRLYALSSTYTLYELDSQTGNVLAARFLSGAIGYISGIDFAPDGTMYAVGYNLQVINPQTGVVTFLFPLGDPQLRDPDLGPDGIIRASAHSYPNQWTDLYEIDPYMGTRTIVGPATQSPPPVWLFGLASRPVLPVPLPASALLFAPACAGLLLFARRFKP